VGLYSMKISADPLHVAAYEGHKLGQEIRFDLDSSNVRFNASAATECTSFFPSM